MTATASSALTSLDASAGLPSLENTSQHVSASHAATLDASPVDKTSMDASSAGKTSQDELDSSEMSHDVSSVAQEPTHAAAVGKRSSEEPDVAQTSVHAHVVGRMPSHVSSVAQTPATAPAVAVAAAVPNVGGPSGGSHAAVLPSGGGEVGNTPSAWREREARFAREVAQLKGELQRLQEQAGEAPGDGGRQRQQLHSDAVEVRWSLGFSSIARLGFWSMWSTVRVFQHCSVRVLEHLECEVPSRRTRCFRIFWFVIFT